MADDSRDGDARSGRGLVTVMIGAGALLVLQQAAPDALTVTALRHALVDGAVTDPLLVVMAGVRAVALVLGWYLVVVVALALLARRAPGQQASRLLRRLVLPPLRGVVAAVTGLALISPSAPAAAGSDLVIDLTVPPGIVAPWTPPADPVTADVPAVSVEPSLLDGRGVDGVEVADGRLIRPLPRDGELQLPGVGPDRAVPDPGDTAPPAPTPSSGQPVAPAGAHVVEAGDSFWSIAADHLAAHDRPTDERSIARYWCELMAANADRLVVAGDPDLVFPGQEFLLPPLPGPTPDGDR